MRFLQLSSASSSSAILTGGIFSLFAGFSLLFASTAGINYLKPAATLDGNPLQWLGGIKIGFNQIELPQEEPKESPKVYSVVAIEKKEKKLFRAAISKKPTIKIVKTNKIDRMKPVVMDQVATVSAASTTDVVTEQQKVQLMHQALRIRFLSAANDIRPAMNTQIAESPRPMAVSIQRKIVTKAKFQTVRRTVAKLVVAREPLPTQFAKDVIHLMSAVPAYAAYPKYSVVQAMRERDEVAQASKLIEKPDVSIQLSEPPPTKSLIKIEAPVVVVPAVAEPPKEVIKESPLKLVEAPATTALMAVNTQPAQDPVEYSTPTENAAVTENSNENVGYSTTVSIQSSQGAPVVPPKPNVSVVPPAPPAEERACMSASASFVEAFDWNTAIVDGQTELMTRENLDDCEMGWRVHTAPKHWPTLTWFNGKSKRSLDATPLLSNNTSRILAQLAGAPVQEQAGIVFGKIPSGWSLEFSGRSEGVVFLNQDNQPVSSTNLASDRYFAFVNAAPGAHIIYFSNYSGTGSLGVPVLSGKATYLDLSSIERRGFSGRVLDGSSATSSGLSQVRVKVVGQPRATALTDRRGSFNIGDVITVAHYPLFVESESDSGFTYRYRFMPNALDQVTLFRMDASQVQNWIGQLEGGVSADSGMILVAAPSLVARHADQKLYPSTKTVLSSTLHPETYPLSPDGMLKDKAPIDAESLRFVSVQVPEGPVITRLEDKELNEVWSELVMASPGVVNVVGPY